MKTLKAFINYRYELDVHPQEIASSVKYLINQNLDFDVFLPTKNMNLQRDLVWSLEQKQEIIMSIITRRHIPHLAILNRFNEVWEVMDGKQRLSAIKEFLSDKFTINLDGDNYLFSELPEDYQIGINRTTLRYYIVNEVESEQISDDGKIKWFKYINFAGTIQDEEHLNKLK